MARPAAAGQQQQVAVLVVVVVVMLMMPSVVVRVSAVSCGQVAGYVTPCISYAMGKGTAPSEACCSGIRNLNAAAAATATADRQATCKCLKQITAVMPALKPDLVAGIPSKCGVDVPYPIARSTDCNKVQ